MPTTIRLQKERFEQSERTALSNGFEMACFTHCNIFSVFDANQFLDASIEHLGQDVDGMFIDDDATAERVIPVMAEFIVWHLLTRVTNELHEDFCANGQHFQWFSTGSPNFIDIYTVKKTEVGWRFCAIEVKWSENCDYGLQVKRGLVTDLIKLHRADYSNCRLGTHITSLKAQLRKVLSPEEIEEIFSSIRAGKAPNDSKGVEFWGFFVSDWNIDNQDHDPDEQFVKLSEQATSDEWPENCVKGFMINIENGKNVLKALAQGQRN